MSSLTRRQFSKRLAMTTTALSFQSTKALQAAT